MFDVWDVDKRDGSSGDVERICRREGTSVVVEFGVWRVGVERCRCGGVV